MSATVHFLPVRKPARTEAEMACRQKYESMTMMLLREQVAQRALDDALRAFDEAERRRVQETY